MNNVRAAFPAASKRSQISPFLAMDVMASAKKLGRAGIEIAHMEVGEPGAPTPLKIREAVSAALAEGRIPYTEALGRPQLREKIAAYYRTHYGQSVSPEQIVVTTGSSGGFILSFLTLFDVGDRVAIAAPGYPAYRNILEALGLEVVEIPTNAASNHALTARLVEAEHNKKPLKGALIMSPANPTGVMMSAEDLRALATLCKRLKIALISDEIYHGLSWGKEEISALTFSDEAIIVNSFSKYFCMTGWRIGWLVVPPHLVRSMECLAQSLAISVPYLSQIAAEAAFEAREELEALKAGYGRNRALLEEALPKLGLPHLPMDGAFYAYCDIARYSNDSMDFAHRALHEAQVALTPGPDFDRFEGHRYVRISYAGSESDCRATIERLGKWLGV